MQALNPKAHVAERRVPRRGSLFAPPGIYKAHTLQTQTGPSTSKPKNPKPREPYICLNHEPERSEPYEL